MGRIRKYPNGKHPEIKALYEGGMTTDEIGKLIGKDKGGVYDMLKRRGTKFRPSGYRPTTKRRPKFQEAIEMFNAGMDYREIGWRLKVRKKYIQRALQRYGVLKKFVPFDYEKIRPFYESGLSIRECAKIFNLGRTAVERGLKKIGVVMRMQARVGSNNNLYRGGSRCDPAAIALVNKAVDCGDIEPKPCETCGEMDVCRDGRRTTVAHHDDYNQPLKVRWLCRKHHHEWHVKNQAIPVAKPK